MELCHFLTRYCPTRLEVSLMVYSACWSVIFYYLGNLLRGILFVCYNQFLLYSCNFSKTGVVFSSFVISMFVL